MIYNFCFIRHLNCAFIEQDTLKCKKNYCDHQSIVEPERPKLTEEQNNVLQMNKYFSLESNQPGWVEGQSRYIKKWFEKIDRNAFILDCACGDGVGLKVFKEMGFKNVVGVEMHAKKVELASKFGYTVFDYDMMKLDNYEWPKFDIVYSSHSLEHVHNTDITIKSFHKILKPMGLLFVVLPYPDFQHDEAHLGKFIMGTDVNDKGEKVCNYFASLGFQVVRKSFDSYREPEIWLVFKKL